MPGKEHRADQPDHHEEIRKMQINRPVREGGAEIAGSPDLTHSEPVDREETWDEEHEAAEKSPGWPAGERGDLSDTGPGED